MLLKKFKFPPHELVAIINFMKQKFIISDLNMQILDKTIKIATNYGFSFWDSMMVTSALNNQCSILYTEDLQHNQIIEGRLKIINPFKNSSESP